MWTVKNFRKILNNPDIPDDAVIHLHTDHTIIDQLSTVILMERPELYPALILSLHSHRTDDNEMIDGKVIEMREWKFDTLDWEADE